MIIYEVLTVVTAVLCAGMTGAFVMLMARMVHTERILLKYSATQVTTAKHDLRNAQRNLAAKVEEFAEITKTASEANTSLGSMLADMENRVVAIDERLSMLQGTTGGSSPWSMKKNQ